MRLSIVRLIAAKETRDLLRDRRTVMLILVLPALLYPLFGAAGYLMASSILNQKTTIGIIGLDRLQFPDSNFPNLLTDSKTAFADGLVKESIELDTLAIIPIDGNAEDALRSKEANVVLVVPEGFVEAVVREQPPPELKIETRDGDEKSKLAGRRLNGILDKWLAQVRRARFEQKQLPKEFDQPFKIVDSQDQKPKDKQTADELRDQFAKVFPFILIVWMVAGAIQPAVDLTSGEKERGTMETLLISPAERSEIVLGKFTAVTLFGFCSVLWNVIWLTTGAIVMEQILGFPILNFVGLISCIVLGLPIAMLFSAIGLALGVFARSTKEGQYYLMPLMLATMPLAFYSMMPGTELTNFTAFIPITGAMLIQQKLLAVQSDPIPLVQYVSVFGSLFLYVIIGLALAVWQFRRESVLFRETGSAKSKKNFFRQLFGRSAKV